MYTYTVTKEEGRWTNEAISLVREIHLRYCIHMTNDLPVWILLVVCAGCEWVIILHEELGQKRELVDFLKAHCHKIFSHHNSFHHQCKQSYPFSVNLKVLRDFEARRHQWQKASDCKIKTAYCLSSPASSRAGSDRHGRYVEDPPLTAIGERYSKSIAF